MMNNHRETGNTIGEMMNYVRGLRVRRIFEENGVVREGHFKLRSGAHSDVYFDKAQIWPNAEATKEICSMFAGSFRGSGVEVVIGPETGGAKLSQGTSRILSDISGREIQGLSAQKDGEGGFVLSDQTKEAVRGKKVLVLEDNISTGNSVRQVIDAVRGSGGEITGVGILCNRGKVTPEKIGVDRMDVLIEVNADEWSSDECPSCKAGISVDAAVGAGKIQTKS